MASRDVKERAFGLTMELARHYASAGFQYEPGKLMNELYKSLIELVEDMEKSD